MWGQVTLSSSVDHQPSKLDSLWGLLVSSLEVTDQSWLLLWDWGRSLTNPLFSGCVPYVHIHTQHPRSQNATQLPCVCKGILPQSTLIPHCLGRICTLSRSSGILERPLRSFSWKMVKWRQPMLKEAHHHPLFSPGVSNNFELVSSI